MKKLQCKSAELDKNLETLCKKTKNIVVLGKTGSGKSYGAINFLKKMNSSNPDFSLKAGYFVCDDGGASYFSTKAFKNLWKEPVTGKEYSPMYETTAAGNPIVIDNVDRSFLTSSYFLDFLRLISKEKNRGTLILVADGENIDQNDVPTDIKNDCVVVEVTDNNHRKMPMESTTKRYTVKNYKGNLLESIVKFQQKHPELKITSAKVSDSDNKLVLEAKMTRAELDAFVKKLNSGAVQFQYRKKDGSLRNACGTRMAKLMSSEDVKTLQEELKKPSVDFLIPYYDFQSKGLRKFHVSRFIKTIEDVEISDKQASEAKKAIDGGAFDSFDSKQDNKMLVFFADAGFVVSPRGDYGASSNRRQPSSINFEQLRERIKEILAMRTTLSRIKIDEVTREIEEAIGDAFGNFEREVKDWWN